MNATSGSSIKNALLNHNKPVWEHMQLNRGLRFIYMCRHMRYIHFRNQFYKHIFIHYKTHEYGIFSVETVEDILHSINLRDTYTDTSSIIKASRTMCYQEMAFMSVIQGLNLFGFGNCFFF